MSELDKLVLYLKEHHIRYSRVDEESNIFKCEGFDICPDRHQVIAYDANGKRVWDAICRGDHMDMTKDCLKYPVA